MTLGRSLLLFVALVSAPALNSQQLQVATNDLQATTLLTSSLNAMVPSATLSGIQDFRIVGTTSSPSGTVTGTFIAKARGVDWSLETSRGPANTSYRVLNGMGSLRVNGNIKQLSPIITSGLPLDVFPLVGRWTAFAAAGAKAQMRGQVTVDGNPCYQVHVVTPNVTSGYVGLNRHNEVDILIDARTGLLVSTAFDAGTESRFNATVRIENRIAGYQSFAGIQVPTQITHFVAGHAHIIYRITSVSINNGFSDADFKN